MFDLRRRNLIAPEIKMVGTNGDKFAGIRQHFKTNIEDKYREMDTSFTGYPEAGKRDYDAYKGRLTVESGGCDYDFHSGLDAFRDRHVCD